MMAVTCRQVAITSIVLLPFSPPLLRVSCLLLETSNNFFECCGSIVIGVQSKIFGETLDSWTYFIPCVIGIDGWVEMLDLRPECINGSAFLAFRLSSVFFNSSDGLFK